MTRVTVEPESQQASASAWQPWHEISLKDLQQEIQEDRFKQRVKDWAGSEACENALRICGIIYQLREMVKGEYFISYFQLLGTRKDLSVF